jgi:hypothetical protein
MRGKNVGNLHLRSHGYEGKEEIWEKEDAKLQAEGTINPWQQFTDPLERAYVRARYSFDKKTGQFVTDPMMKKLEEHLVISY